MWPLKSLLWLLAFCSLLFWPVFPFFSDHITSFAELIVHCAILEMCSMLNVTRRVTKQIITEEMINGLLVLEFVISGMAQSAYVIVNRDL